MSQKFDPISLPPGSQINYSLDFDVRKKFTVRFADGSEVTMALDPGSILSVRAMQDVTLNIGDDDLGDLSPDRVLN